MAKPREKDIRRARIAYNKGRALPNTDRWRAAQNVARKRMAKRRATPEWQAKHGKPRSLVSNSERVQRKTGIPIDQRGADRSVRNRNISKGKSKRTKPFFNPKAKIDRSQIQVRKSKSATPYHWRTNKTKREVALKKRWKRESKADLDMFSNWREGKSIDWRRHAYDATTGYDNYMNGRDLKKKFPVMGNKRKMVQKAAKRRTGAKGRSRAV